SAATWPMIQRAGLSLINWPSGCLTKQPWNSKRNPNDPVCEENEIRAKQFFFVYFSNIQVKYKSC
ncbi:MAG: hypothetical protein VYD34_02640, partial [Verrucomicrobiota bacterium]|nr:hypothetical protein [Verrucomicrobiota bacterium]